MVNFGWYNTDHDSFEEHMDDKSQTAKFHGRQKLIFQSKIRMIPFVIWRISQLLIVRQLCHKHGNIQINL